MIFSPDIARAAFLVVALGLAGIGHVYWLKTRWSQHFKQPIDGGGRLRGRRLLGANKTLRGFMAMPPAAALSFVVLSELLRWLAPAWHAQLWPLSAGAYAALGFGCGLAFMLAELPNSFLKRQLDVAPGQLPDRGALRLACAVWDRIDSTVGVLLLLWLLPGVGAPAAVWAWALLLGPSVHAAFSVWLHRAGVKGRAL
ncbi:MAG: hypothetical protein AB7L76_07080 [Burkholderiaceae bacterium]